MLGVSNEPILMDIYLFNEIDNNTGAEVVRQISEATEPITLHINSYGGDVFAAIAIGHAIRNSPQPVTCAVEGICASAATLISSASSKVTIAHNSLMMTHSPLTMLMGYYNSQDLSEIKAALEKVEESIARSLKARLKGEVDLSQEHWYNAEEAVAAGLADEVTGSVEMQIDNRHKLIYVNKCVFKVENMPAQRNAAQAQFAALVSDQKNSGASKVKGSLPDNRKALADKIVAIANQKFGGSQ